MSRVPAGMYVPAKEAFAQAMKQLKIPRSSTIVVGLSGGPDSVALTYLAKQAFRRVIAVTVDHRLREESGKEAERAGEIARSLEAEHIVVPLDWGEKNGHRTASKARYMRYNALMEQCERLRGDMLMVGHHANDQIETVIMRMMTGSGIIGLGGMHLTSRWVVNPNLNIVRPLLECSKLSLVQLCREQGLEWVEDPSNLKPTMPRNKLRPILQQHPDILSGLADMMALCREAKEASEPRVKDAIQRLASVNDKYGTLSFHTSTYQALNPYVSKSVLAIWLRYIASSGNSVQRYGLEKLHNLVMQERTASDTNGRCILIPLPKVGKFMIAKQKPVRGKAARVPIRVGETVLWDNRFQISLFAKSEGQWRGMKEVEKYRHSEAELVSKVFYIRHFLSNDHLYVTRGVRKVKGSVLVHYHVRGGLPVITDSDGEVVLIPHFRVINHYAGVDCKVEFTPLWSMWDLLHFHYISEESTHRFIS